MTVLDDLVNAVNGLSEQQSQMVAVLNDILEVLTSEGVPTTPVPPAPIPPPVVQQPGTALPSPTHVVTTTRPATPDEISPAGPRPSGAETGYTAPAPSSGYVPPAITPTSTGSYGTQPAPEQVSVPDVVGKNVDSAKSKLNAVNLVADTQRDYNSAKKDDVYKQKPSGGTKVNPRSTVTLYVSRGPKERASDDDSKGGKSR